MLGVVRILTNPGSNLSEPMLAHYDILLSRQQIVVDGVDHDTRRDIPLGQVDQWVQSAKNFPKVVGSTSVDMLPLLTSALQRDPSLLIVTTSRRLIQTYDSASAALEKLRALHPEAKVGLVDSKTTDVGAGLIALAAAEAARQGWSLGDTVKLLDTMAAGARMLVYAHTLENMHKSGRATFLKAWVAQVLKVRPLVAMDDGALRVCGRVKLDEDIVPALLEQTLERVPAGSRIWLGVAHSNDPALAERCRRLYAETFDVAYTMIRPLSASIYLYAGPGALCVAAVPIDGLPKSPPTPSV